MARFNPAQLASSSAKLNMDRIGLMIYGPPKIGKSWLAATASENYDAEKLKTGERMVLDDVIWITADRNALLGLRESNIVVPHTLDLYSWMTGAEDATFHAQDILEARDAAVSGLEHIYLANKGKIKTVIIDTVSELDRMFVDYWLDPGRVPLTGGGSPDTQRAYGNVASTHNNFFKAVNYMPTSIIVLCHAKVNNPAVSTDKRQADVNEAKLKAMALGGAATSDLKVVPAITGKGAEAYERNVDQILVMSASKSLDKKSTDKFNRKVHPYGGDGWAGGSRLQKYMAASEPANIRQLKAKVQAAIDADDKKAEKGEQ